ncbi:hypothetical protein [Marinirhabdus gelatinilytica]|uniref:Uncharacterized protein n=1 Tax=Marinirhabdus gelatinilytica TaxID=1703343 RepID=A0A370QJB1_9FLAO|nr:hypothetical protein [Marinirhabdus gelatinilytica]RDK88429.1 hypothetical protein C8D94_101301 [Marinirhabdus gelatinilytica]
MKKKLQQDLQDLAKEILQEQCPSTVQLKKKVAAIYEKLTILEHLEQQIEGETTVPSKNEIESFDSKSYKEQNWFTEPEPIPQPQHKEDLVEPLIEKIKDLVAQMPAESQQVDKILEEVLPKKKYMKNDLEEFASTYQQTPTFERKTTTEKAPKAEKKFEERQPAKGVPVPENKKRLIDDLGMSEKPKSINDQVASGMNIGLNDRLAYVKHLFNGNTEDYTRVLSQINTIETFEEAQTFIKTKVKPDYNFWAEKQEYEDRFMALVEKKFN